MYMLTLSHYQWVKHGLILPKTESYHLKHIHKVNFYPSDKNFTQALLVMLVTNIFYASPYFLVPDLQSSILIKCENQKMCTNCINVAGRLKTL